MENSSFYCYNIVEVRGLIIKYRERPAKIAGYEALLKRISPNHPKRKQIQEKLNNTLAGFGGEERLDRMLKYFDPPYPYLLMQDLSLPGACQVDTMIITKSRIFLLEVKNIGGRLKFTTNPSTLQKVLPNGELKGFKSPLVQAATTKLKVERVLKSINCSLPVQSIIVIAFPSQIIENVPAGALVWSADEVFFQLMQMEMGKNLISLEEMNAVGNHMLNVYESYNPFPLIEKFGMEITDIQAGVFCPDCRLIKMARFHRRWRCEKCSLVSRDAHHEAINEWFMLCKLTISTAECLTFLGLNDLDAAKRLLKRIGLREMGGRRHRYYIQQDETR